MTIEKKGDISTLQPKLLRRAGNGDVPLIHYKYSKDKGYHVPVDALDIEDEKVTAGHGSAKKLAEIIFRPPTALRHKDAVKKIIQELKIQQRAATERIVNMRGWGFIVKGPDKHYRLKSFVRGVVSKFRAYPLYLYVKVFNRGGVWKQ